MKTVLYCLPAPILAGIGLVLAVVAMMQVSSVGDVAATTGALSTPALADASPSVTSDFLESLASYDGSVIPERIESTTPGETRNEYVETCRRLMQAQRAINKALENHLATDVGSDESVLTKTSMSFRQILSRCDDSAAERTLASELAKICSQLSSAERSALLRQEVPRLRQSFDAAFAKGEYQEVRSLGDSLLLDYEAVLTDTEREHILLQKERAAFHEGLDNLDRMVAQATDDQEKRTLLSRFLQPYAKADELSPEMRDAIAEREHQLEQIDETLADMASAERVATLVSQLRDDKRTVFPETLVRAAEILADNPGAQTTRILRTYCRECLRSAFPERASSVPQELLEFEYREPSEANSRYVSGYIRTVSDDTGKVKGYRVFKTKESFDNPHVQVGIYTRESVVERPTTPVPADCVRRYNEAREEFLLTMETEAEAKRCTELCRQFADTCSQLTSEMESYNAKPGALNIDMSFAEEASLLTTIADQPVWQGWCRVVDPALGNSGMK